MDLESPRSERCHPVRHRHRFATKNLTIIQDVPAGKPQANHSFLTATTEEINGTVFSRACLRPGASPIRNAHRACSSAPCKCSSLATADPGARILYSRQPRIEDLYCRLQKPRHAVDAGRGMDPKMRGRFHYPGGNLGRPPQRQSRLCVQGEAREEVRPRRHRRNNTPKPFTNLPKGCLPLPSHARPWVVGTATSRVDAS